MRIIFENAAEKTKKYDSQRKGKQYNEAYWRVLNARAGNNSLVNGNGNVSEQSVRAIEDTLKEFEMARFGKMDWRFGGKLKSKLERNDIKEVLKEFRNLRIESQEWQRYRDDVKKLYDTLSAEGSDGLSADGKRFDVGATKIMNFLFPELFVMVDKNVAKTLISLGVIKIPRKGGTYNFSFESYWQIMHICHEELQERRKLHGNIQSLLELDGKPTTLTRIFDKCTFIFQK